MSSMAVPQMERIHFFDGERLTAEDLNAEQQLEREIRWLHNRTLHGWGIATGFGVTGKKGALAVSVAPGMALDILGREIILASELMKGIPALAGGSGEQMFFLTAAYQPDSAQKVLSQRDGVCAPGGAVRLANDPLIEWHTPATVIAGRQIILAAIWINNCKLARAVSGAPRRLLTPSKTPSVRSGLATNLMWSPFEAANVIVGFTAPVDTSAAQFKGTPQYLAQIVGENYLAVSPGPALMAPQTSIVNPSLTGFTLQVLLPQSTAGVPVNPPAVRNAQSGPAILKALAWQISWIGVES